jgi:hypothetical protein
MVALRQGRTRRLRVPKAMVAAKGSPFAAVIKLGRFDNPEHVVIAIIGAILAHGVIGLGVGLTHVVVKHDEPRRKVEVAVALQKPPPPVPKPPEPPPPKPPEPPPEHHEKVARTSEPPAPAQAARVVAQADIPSGPVDMTAFDLVVGKGDTYAGGYTASSGTSKVAVENVQATPHATGPPQASRARPPAPARTDWACTWPEDAQETDIRDARTSIRVHVDRDGEPEEVDIVSSPSPSFAEAARRCALGESYRTALDDAGKAIAGVTPLFIVHFVR